MEYWVDGYNLIFRRRRGGTVPLEQERERLLSAVAALRVPVRVYFDASKGPARVPPPADRPRVTPVFVTDRSADDAMIDDLRRAPRGTVTLVSDDRELRGRARQVGAGTVRVASFLEKIQKAQSPLSRPGAQKASGADRGGKQGRLSQAEVDEWMRWFGFDEEDSEPPPEEGRERRP